MRRVTTGILLAFAAAFLFGCGGSTTALPGGNNDGTGADNNPSNFIAPDSVDGDHSVATLPGQVNVVGSTDRAKLQAVLDKYGYTLLRFKNGYSTVQVPVGTEQAAIEQLTKEYSIIKAEPVRLIQTQRANYATPTFQKGASFYPQFPDYGEVTFGLGTDGTNFSTNFNFVGQAFPMNLQNFNGGWQVTIDNAATASQPVEIAIIDAGWFDYSVEDQPGLNDVADDVDVPGTVLDVANSGSVDAAGVFTPGLTACKWDLDTNSYPYRTVGASMLGVLAGGSDGFVASVQGADLDGSGQVDQAEIWNVGIMGCNPNATYMLIKTGTVSGGTPPVWQFSDTELSESIDHAVASGANIILLGMAAPGTVSANLSASIAAARGAGVLVIVPAGDVVLDWDGTGFPNAPVDIQTTDVTPASDPNVVSVSSSGINRGLDALPDVDFGNGPIPNDGVGWFPNFTVPLGSDFHSLAPWSNTGATIASTGYGLGFGPAPYLVNGADRIPGITYVAFLDTNFGSFLSAAYVAGAASMVYQTLAEVNGTPPTDVEVLNELLSTVQFKGMTGVDDPTAVGPDDGGLLDAGLAVTSAVNGGGLVNTLPALQFTQVQASQPFLGVTRGTDFSLTGTIVNGTAPFTMTVDWGDGTPPDVVNNWTNSTPVDKIGGYADLGLYGATLTVEDANSLTVSFPLAIRVINPFAATITIESATGAAVAPTALKVATTYRFNANPANVFTGGGNTTTFSWDFNGDLTEDATGPTPTFSFPSAGPNTVTLTVIETLRPDTVRTQAVTVSP